MNGEKREDPNMSYDVDKKCRLCESNLMTTRITNSKLLFSDRGGERLDVRFGAVGVILDNGAPVVFSHWQFIF